MFKRKITTLIYTKDKELIDMIDVGMIPQYNDCVSLEVKDGETDEVILEQEYADGFQEYAEQQRRKVEKCKHEDYNNLACNDCGKDFS